MDINQQLEQIGLGGKKADIYLALLQLGKASVLQISKKAGTKRPTTYDVLEELKIRGLVSQTFTGKRTLFVAEDPKTLKTQLKKQEEKINSLLPELSSLYNVKTNKPKIQYYEGQSGIRQIYEEILNGKEMRHYYFGSIKEMIDVIGKEWLDDWINRRIQRGKKPYAIRIKSKERHKNLWGHGEEFKKDLRFFPIDIKEDVVTITLFDNKIAIMSALKESYGIIIESNELALTFKYLWKILWAASKQAN